MEFMESSETFDRFTKADPIHAQKPNIHLGSFHKHALMPTITITNMHRN